MAKIDIKKIDNNMKAINFETWGGFQGFLDSTSNGQGGSASVQNLRRVVPWLAKATDMTSNAIATLPFEIVNDSGTVVDSSEDWKNKLGGIENPQLLISMLASSLCLGRAYLIPTYTTKTIASLQYCAPHTITPQINMNGLQYFDRSTDHGKTEKYYPMGEQKPELMYFWLPDSDVEIGPALSYPAGAALLSATLLFSMDGTIQTYAERGFVPATLLSVQGRPPEAEREKTELWWNRFLRGWTTTQAKIINAEAMDIKQVGAGMEQLKGAYGELTKQAIENVGTAYGIPAALFMSDMAFATEIKGLTKTWYETGAFVKIYKTIEDTFNSQLLVNYGLKMQFRPETLDVFADDEVASASAFKTYVDAGILPSVAAQMVGMEMPNGVKYEDLDAQVERKQAQEDEAARVNNEVALAKLSAGKEVEEKKPEEKPKEKIVEKKDISLSADQIKELALWRQIAERCERKGKGRAVDFECKTIPAEMADDIREKLQSGTIAQAFEVTNTPIVTRGYDSEGLKALAEAINRATDIPEVKAQPNSYTFNIPSPTIEQPSITITVPEQQPPNITVTSPEVKVINEVSPTPVTIENTVNVPEEKNKKLKVIRDNKGVVTGMEEK